MKKITANRIDRRAIGYEVKIYYNSIEPVSKLKYIHST
jgi:hypothetical protein